MKRVRICAALVISFCLIRSQGADAGVPIPADPASVKSLDGTWRFKLEQAEGKDGSPGEHWTGKLPVKCPETFEPFDQGDYKEGAGWHDIKVPGNWEMPGHSPATYKHPDNASAFYRLQFDVPAEWKGRIVKITSIACRTARRSFSTANRSKSMSQAGARITTKAAGRRFKLISRRTRSSATRTARAARHEKHPLIGCDRWRALSASCACPCSPPRRRWRLRTRGTGRRI